MAGSNKYAIHSDFAKIPSVNLRFSPLIVAILNAISRLVRFFQKRRFDLMVAPHVIESGTGQAVDVKVLTPHNIKPNAPALVYYHGGGFALTYAALHLHDARQRLSVARQVQRSRRQRERHRSVRRAAAGGQAQDDGGDTVIA